MYPVTLTYTPYSSIAHQTMSTLYRFCIQIAKFSTHKLSFMYLQIIVTCPITGSALKYRAEAQQSFLQLRDHCFVTVTTVDIGLFQIMRIHMYGGRLISIEGSILWQFNEVLRVFLWIDFNEALQALFQIIKQGQIQEFQNGGVV